jgi:hypothetical protein
LQNKKLEWRNGIWYFIILIFVISSSRPVFFLGVWTIIKIQIFSSFNSYNFVILRMFWRTLKNEIHFLFLVLIFALELCRCLKRFQDNLNDLDNLKNFKPVKIKIEWHHLINLVLLKFWSINFKLWCETVILTFSAWCGRLFWHLFIDFVWLQANAKTTHDDRQFFRKTKEEIIMIAELYKGYWRSEF